MKYRIVTRSYYRVDADDEDEAVEVFDSGEHEFIEDVVEEVYPEDAPEDDADGWA
jgi:hypothetical protein